MLFFSTKDNIPAGMGFETFDITHLLWLAVITILCFAASFLYLRSNEKRRSVMRIVIGCTVILLEILKDAVYAVRGELDAELLPLHLCGINILLIGFDLLKPTTAVRNFLYYFCIPGALLALFFPNWTVLPCMNFSHIHSFIVHALLVSYPLLLVVGGEVVADIRSILKSIVLLICMAIPIYFINLLLDTNFMFLMEPETGNPLGLFEKYLGNHLWGFPILLPIVMLIMYIPLYLLTKHREKAKNKV